MKLKPLARNVREILAKAGGASQHRHAPGQITINAVSDDRVQLFIYGYIGEDFWADESLTAQAVVNQLKGLSPAVIDVRINSIGGSVSDGIAIHNELRRHARAGTRINVHVDGVACSIASLIAMAGDVVVMPASATMMLHAPWGYMWVEGNAQDVRNTSEAFANALEAMGAAMAEAYARKTSHPPEEYLALWASGEDHWYTAAACLEAGLCDEIEDAYVAPAEADPATDPFTQAVLARAPEQLRAGIVAAAKQPAPIVQVNQAAPSAAIQHQGTTMPKERIQADVAAVPENSEVNAAQNALAAIQARNTAIRAASAPHLGNASVREYVDNVIAAADPAVTVDQVNSHMLALLAAGREPLGGRVTSTDRDGLRAAMRDALNARSGLAQPVSGNPYNGMSLFDLARAAAETAGFDTRGQSRMEIVATAFTHTSSDFPILLSNTAGAALLRGYNEVELDISTIAGRVTLGDFRATQPSGLGVFSDLDKVPESQEYKYGTFSAANGTPMKLSTYGKLFSISRQAIINDDVGYLTDVPRKMGQAAKRTLIKELFALLVSNPIMPDGIALFHASRGNLLSAGVINTANVDAMRVAMASLKDGDGNLVGGSLSKLLVPMALGGLARSVATSQFVIDASAKNATQPNYLQNTFSVVDTARLEGTPWYGIDDPSIREGLVVGYLDGNETPYLEQQSGFTVDGVAWKVRHDAAVGIGDPQALSKNPGA